MMPPGGGRKRTVTGSIGSFAFGCTRVSVLTCCAALARLFAFHS